MCVKVVPDPEGPPSSFLLSPEGRVVPVGIPPVLNPFDENALELALRLKDKHGETWITVVSAGQSFPSPCSEKRWRRGRTSWCSWRTRPSRSWIPPPRPSSPPSPCGGWGGLVLTGRQASDWSWGLTGLMLAERLGLPAISLVCELKAEGGGAVAKRLSPGGLEAVRVPLQALFTVTGGAGEPRGISLTDLREAMKKPVELWRAKDLGVEASSLRRRKKVELKPVEFRRRGEVIEGKTPEEAGEKLASKLLEEGIA